VPKFPLRSRQIHLDFHTGLWIPDVGSDFDAKEFAQTMKRAHVNSVTVFAKCHHGHLYYATKRPERHPGLKAGLNLLGEQVEALHREGIRAPIYISVQCDEYAADNYPQWIARKPDGAPVGAGPLSPGWQILDMSSPYQDYLAEQTKEVLKLFKPVDGIFFDMCWDQPSLNNYTVEAMQKENLDPENEEHRKKFAHEVTRRYMKRFYDMVKAASKNATVYFNSRPLHNLADEIQWQFQVEIEALPTGGWGYMYFPKNVRFARTFGKPYLGMTARFHKSWADFGGLKPYAALEYETSQMMAHGARCSIGDQLHPRGTLDKAAYDLIGKVYARVEEREPWLEDAVPVAQIGLFQVPTRSADVLAGAEGADEGATRMLTQLKQQFDVVIPDSDLGRYELLILPDCIPVDANLAAKLRQYVRKGGALLASGTSGLTDDGESALLNDLGIKPEGRSEYTTTYLRFGPEIAADVPATDHVMYEPPINVTPAAGAVSLSRIVEPYFQRSWRHFSSHNQTPQARMSRFSGAVRKGNVAYIAYPIFSAFANHGNVPCRLLVRNILSLLLPEPLLKVDAPTSTEATVTRQVGRASVPAGGQGRPPYRTIVHLLQYCPERRTPKLDIVEDIVPLYNVPLSLKLPRKPTSVYLAPGREPVSFTYDEGRVSLYVPEVRGHQMIVFE
jgi:hypothetical protein